MLLAMLPFFSHWVGCVIVGVLHEIAFHFVLDCGNNREILVSTLSRIYISTIDAGLLEILLNAFHVLQEGLYVLDAFVAVYIYR